MERTGLLTNSPSSRPTELRGCRAVRTKRSRSQQVAIRRCICFSVLFPQLLVTGSLSAKQNQEAARPSQRIFLSLKVLSQEISKAKKAGKPIGREPERLAGLNWIEGFVVDRENQDLVLFGRQVCDRPSLHLDDLVVALRNLDRGTEDLSVLAGTSS